MVSLPTGTVTFLFTDIEGSTTLLQRLGDRRYAEILEEHRRLLRAAFEKGKGQEVDTQGDAFLVAFHRARDAVATAVAAQRALTKYAWPDSASLRVRMGLHTGEPVSGTSDYVGLDVHRASRICSVAHGGQILVSQAVRILVAPDLPPEVSLQDLGTHRLKDLQEPEHLFQVVHPDLPTDFRPLKTLSALPNNLPSQLTSFIGREREKAEIKRLLGTTRLLTLTGSGGAGKTRLALQVATDLLNDFLDGVWLVELAPLSDPTLVPQVVASVLTVCEQPGQPILTALENDLRTKRLLLVLDNCEHLVAACAHLADMLLRTCVHLRVLATSREALGIAGETTWRVPSLSSPDPGRPVPLKRLSEYEAVRLFIERAAAGQPSFALSDRNARAVVQVCHHLDGIPLALELAAAAVRGMSVEQIAARLDDRFRLLIRGSRTALPRHQTLKAAMDWSYKLLSQQEQILLRRLSVFARGFTLEAAESVCAEGIGSSEVLDLLLRLVDKSLVLAEGQGGEIRYRLLETVRQYARDRLLESDEFPMLRGRHLDWYLALAERASRKWQHPDETPWLDQLEREHDNLRAALDWALGSDNVEPGLRLAGALGRLWYLHGYLSEGRERLKAILSRGDDSPTAPRSNALLNCGILALRQGDHAAARPLLEEALKVDRHLGDKEGIARSLLWLANLASFQRDLRAARSYYHESLAIWRELGNNPRIGNVLNDLGGMLMSTDPTEAQVFLEESLAVLRASGSKAAIAIPLLNLALLASVRGDHAQAHLLADESLALLREVGRRERIPSALARLGCVAVAEGDYDKAEMLLEESLALARELGTKLVIGGGLRNLGDLALLRGDYVRARSLLEESLRLAQDVGNLALIADSHRSLGHLEKSQGNADRAAALYRRSLKYVVEGGARVEVPPCLEGLAAVATTRQQWDRAACLLGAADALRQILGIPVPSFERPDYDTNVGAARSAVGEESFTTAWAEGRAMTLEQAIEYALKESP